MSTRPRGCASISTRLTTSKGETLFKNCIRTEREYLSAALEQYSAQYTTRDSMEEAVAQAYGMDTESVKAYLARIPTTSCVA